MIRTKISIIIPAYNEQKTINKVVTEILDEVKVLSNSKTDFEVIVVDDGSADKTVDELKGLNINLVRHPYNKGYGASLKTGAINAKGDYVLYIDGDGQHTAKDLKKFVKDIGKYDMVVGARSKQASALRSLGKVFLHKLANYLAETKIPDLNSGFRLIRRELVIKNLHLLPNSFSFTTTITLALFKGGYNVGYVPIIIRNRKGGKSSIRPFKDGFRFIMLMLRVSMIFSPLRVFLPISFLLFLGGIPLLVSRLVLYQQTSETSLLLILSGLLIFFFGLIADQISMLLRGER